MTTGSPGIFLSFKGKIILTISNKIFYAVRTGIYFTYIQIPIYLSVSLSKFVTSRLKSSGRNHSIGKDMCMKALWLPCGHENTLHKYGSSETSEENHHHSTETSTLKLSRLPNE